MPIDVLTQLAEARLGDLVVLPDGRSLSVRARASLPTPVGSMAGFVLCGEFEVLLGTPSSAAAPVDVYVPLPKMPESVKQARVVQEGAATYWAPHLPALKSAMSELLYRIVEVRGQVDPVVIVWRGKEPVVFVRASFADPDDLDVKQMPDEEVIGDVRRESAVTSSGGISDDAAERVRKSLYERVVS